VCLVVSDVSGNDDLISNGENGLMFAPGRADLLAVALKRVIESPELRSSLGSNAWRDSQRYTWEAAAAQTLEVMRRAITEHVRLRPVTTDPLGASQA
jgi:glycosyltransferase involved in cell wall biosynthesis